MSNDERNSGGSGDGANGGGGGRGRDFVDDGAEADDPTVVIVISDAYTRDAIGRLGRGLRRTAALCRRFRKGGEAISLREAIAILGELEERLTEDIPMHAEGAARGVGRVRRDLVARERAERLAAEAAKKTKEGTT